MKFGKMALAAAGIALGGWLAGPTQGAGVLSISDAIASILTAEAPGVILPVVFEDDDFSYVIKGPNNTGPGLEVGDIVTGILEVQAVRAGSPKNSLFAPGISKTSPSINIGAGTLYNELTAAFELVVTGGGIDSNGNPYALLSSPSSFTEALSGVAGAIPGQTAIMIFEDPLQDFNVGVSRPADKATAVNGVVWANIGFIGVGTEFYKITDVADVPAGQGTTVSEAVEFSLNYIQAPPPPSAPWGGWDAAKNNFGTDVYAGGVLKKYGPGDPKSAFYDRNSDIDAVVFYVPLPSAAWAGLSLMSAMFGLQAWRRFRQA